MKKSYLSIEIDSKADMFKQRTERSLNDIYYKFSVGNGQILNDIKSLDSSLTIHQYVKGNQISKSLVFNFVKKEVTLITYNLKEAVICKLNSQILETNQTKLKKIQLIKKNIPLNNIWVNHDADPTYYGVEIYNSNGGQLYYVCIEGLPASNFVKHYVLSNDSEWSMIKSVFGR